jgi:hypothetical protein
MRRDCFDHTHAARGADDDEDTVGALAERRKDGRAADETWIAAARCEMHGRRFDLT